MDRKQFTFSKHSLNFSDMRLFLHNPRSSKTAGSKRGDLTQRVPYSMKNDIIYNSRPNTIRNPNSNYGTLAIINRNFGQISQLLLTNFWQGIF